MLARSHASGASVSDTGPMAGRFAPSPTGDLHLGNLRTAAIAWLAARSRGDEFVVRMEDLDRHQSSVDIEVAQLRDLAALGIDWDGSVARQSDRFDRYEAAIDALAARGLVYECFCSRREIRQEIASAAHAPHGPPGSYPGTCRSLTDRARADRATTGRRPALRLRTDGQEIAFVDRVHGAVSGLVDDVVLRRNDGVPRVQPGRRGRRRRPRRHRGGPRRRSAVVDAPTDPPAGTPRLAEDDVRACPARGRRRR